MTNPAVPLPRPRIWAVGISKLRDLFRDIAADYDDSAELQLVSRGFEEAAREIREADAAARPDIVVAAGSNGAYLKARVDVPVVLVNPTGFDVMHALARARRETEASGSVALVTHGDTPAEVRRFVAAYGLDVRFASYQSAQDAQACVLDLRDRGVTALVGPGLVTDLAARAGMQAVFVYSRASVRAAFDTALEVAQATRAEAVRRLRLDNVLQHLRDGVVALDAQGRIEALNQRFAAVLGIAPSAAVGRALAELAPELAAGIPDHEVESLASVRGLSYVVHRGPLVDSGMTSGTVLTFQESRAVERLDRTLRSRQRAQQFAARYRLDDLVGACPAIEDVRKLVRRYAKSDATVLIRGDSGTGKEMVAQSLHQLSARRDFPFVAINCGAFPEALLESELFGYEEGAFTGARRGGKAGLIEAAHRGTLFLDEIGEMPLPLQSRLLRVLQEREVVRLGSTEPTRIDVRIVAATHRALTEAVHAGEFRADLYYRLNILNIGLPPLRERQADIMPLAAVLLRDAARREPRLAARIDSAAAAAQLLAPVHAPLVRHAWPGNVRELQNVIERIAVELAERSEAAAGALAPLNEAVLQAIAPELFDGARLPRALDAIGTAGSFARFDAANASTRAAPDASSDAASARAAASGPLTLRQRRRRVEADEIRAALEACNGDRDHVCRLLGISKTTLWRKLNASA
jgi:propionate catabolism operon transcriptional regulator